LSEEEIQEKFAGKLTKNVSGPAYEVVSRVMKHLVQRKITVPGSFKGVGGAQCLTCSYKASSGLLFPLERGFMYIFKPPVHVRFDEIASVNFARGAMKVNKSFDFEIETRNKSSYVFSNIERDQYTALYDFVSKKKLKIKNIGKGGYVDTMRGSDDDDSDDNAVHDPYMMRMKAEAADRDENGDDDDSESDDEDFKPEDNGEEVAEEFDSNASSSGSDEEGEGRTKRKKPRRGSGSDEEDDGDEEDSEEEERPKKRKKERRQKEGGRKRTKKAKDPNAPKRPMSAYMAWLNDNRNQIKEDNPGIGVTEVSKIAGQLWKKVTSEEKEKYEEKYRSEMDVYREKMKDYTPPESSSESSRPPSKKSKTSSKPSSSKLIPHQSPGKFKSKETISQSDDATSSSSDDEKPEKAPKQDSSSDEEASKPSEGRKKGDASDVEVKDEEEMGTESEAEDTPASSEDSD